MELILTKDEEQRRQVLNNATREALKFANFELAKHLIETYPDLIAKEDHLHAAVSGTHRFHAFVRISDFHFCLGGSFKCVKLLLSLKGSCTLESISCLPLESLENTSFGTPYECAKNISKNPLVMKYYDTSSYPEILDLLRSQRKG